MTKIADKLAKVSDSFTINRYDNGFMIEVGGKTAAGDWSSSKIIVKTIEELTVLVEEAATLELDD